MSTQKSIFMLLFLVSSVVLVNFALLHQFAFADVDSSTPKPQVTQKQTAEERIDESMRTTGRDLGHAAHRAGESIHQTAHDVGQAVKKKTTRNRTTSASSAAKSD